MNPYLKRLHSALNESHVTASPPSGLDPSPDAPATVKALADAWRTQGLKALKYPDRSHDALRRALHEELRSESVDNQSIRAQNGLRILDTHTHATTLADAGDVSLAARVACFIDETEYKDRLLEMYEALNGLR